MLGAIISLPWRLVRAPISTIIIPKAPGRHLWHLPVSGLDEGAAQDIVFSLRRAARTEEESAIAEEWLEALQLAQVAFGRVLSELDEAEASLSFWENRVKQQHHFWFIWLQQGPQAFVHKAAQVLHMKQAQRGSLTTGELMEKRVLVYRLLRDALCAALADIQMAADRLHLPDQTSADGRPREMFDIVDEAVELCAGSIQSALENLSNGMHAVLERTPGPEDAGAGEDHALRAAIGRVLGLSGMRRIMSFPAQLVSRSGAKARTTSLSGEESPPPASPVHHRRSPARLTGIRSSSATAQVLASLQRVLGLRRLAPSGATVHDALRAAAASSAALSRRRRFVSVPDWARPPSQLERHWVRYALTWALVGGGAVFLYRHSPLAGSDDLVRWWRTGTVATRGALDRNVAAPLAALRDELFTTLRARPSIVSLAEYEADRDSLARMLVSFEADRGGPQQAVHSLETSDAQLMQGMDTMMRTYERELRSPVRNLVTGDLARCLLIQVQKLKVDSESAMLEMDQILKSNELSIALVAAVPAFLIAGGLLYWAAQLVTPPPPDARTEAVPARLALVQSERCLARLVTPEDGQDRELALGLFIYNLALAYEQARLLFAKHRSLLGGGSRPEWQALEQELLELAAPAPVARKLAAMQRILRAYSIYQQF